MKGFLKLNFIFFIITKICFTQGGDSTLLRRGYLGENEIRSSYYNDGAFSGFNSGIDIRGEWPKGSGQFYIGDMSFLVGLEFVNSLGDTVHSVIIPRGPRNKQNDERHPVYGYFWGFNPVPGYFNLSHNQIATSNQPDTWPTIWPDHPEYGSNVWNGLFGANSFVGNLETFFKIDDTQDDEFNTYFLPDSANPSMKGHGIRVFVRYIQINHPLFKDMLFRVFDIKNDGNYPFEKVFWGNITGTISGGDGDSGDDLSFINNDKNLVYSWDSDGIGNAGQRVAYMGEGLIKSPSGNSFGSFNFFNLTASPAMNNDELLWNRFKSGRIDSLTPIPQDGDHLYGTKYFSLLPGEIKRVVMVLGFDYEYNNLVQKILYAKMLWNSNFQINEMLAKVTLNNINYHRTFSGMSTITWTSSITGGNIDLMFSSDLGRNWIQVTSSHPNNGIYNWNTNNFPDCSFGQLKIIIYNENGDPVGFNESHLFTINNIQNGEPFVRITNIEYDTTLTSGTFNIRLLLGDPEKQQLNVSFYYSRDNGINFSNFYSLNLNPDTVQITTPLEIGNLLNSSEAKFKVVVSDGNSMVSDISEKFIKKTDRTSVNTQYLAHITGPSELPYQINVVDSTKLTGDEYLISFNDISMNGEKYFSVYNLTRTNHVLLNENLYPNFENKAFDGLTFFANEISTVFNPTKSGWNQNVSQDFNFDFRYYFDQTYIQNNGYAMPGDYQIIYYDTIVDTSIADTLYPIIPRNIFQPTPVNFKVKNTSLNQFVRFAYKKTGTITTVHSIFFKEHVNNNLMRTWRLVVRDPAINVSPIGGDTLTLTTIKGFSIFDTLKVLSIPLGVEDILQLTTDYILFQNYPNPFNPLTTIKFQLEKAGKVSLVVYDILGRKVTTLLNEEKSSGVHSVVFDAGLTRLASGIYFYELKSNEYRQIKKMMVVK